MLLDELGAGVLLATEAGAAAAPCLEGAALAGEALTRDFPANIDKSAYSGQLVVAFARYAHAKSTHGLLPSPRPAHQGCDDGAAR